MNHDSVKKSVTVCLVICVALLLTVSCRVEEGADSSANGGIPPAGERLTWRFPAEQLREDFVQLRNALENNHPARLRYETEGELNHLFNTAYDSLQDPMTELEFYRVVAPLVARYHCGHTVVRPSGEFFDDINAMGLSLPLGIFRSEGKAYVDADYDSGSGIVPGSEVLSINGVAIDQIYSRMMAGMPADALNTSRKISRLNRAFNLYHYFFWGEFTQFDVVVKNSRGEEETVTVDAREYTAVTSAVGERFTHNTNQLMFEIEGNHAVLTVPSFGISHNPDYQSYFEDVFTRLNNLGIENLIVDVRGNGGGDPEMSVALISHLTNEPFVYFKAGLGYGNLFSPTPPHGIHFNGDVYVLIDGGCFSTTGHFCSMVRHLDLGTFIGEIGGGTYRCNDNSTSLNLSHTGIYLNVARTTYETAVPDHDVSEGFAPDHRVVPTIDDILNGVDSQMSYVLQLIAGGD